MTDRILADVAPYIAALPGPVGRETSVPRVTVWSSTTATSRISAIFEPMFYVIVRGAKVLTMGVNRFELAAGQCAASSFGLPYSHELVGAERQRPYVGISLHIDRDLLSRVALSMPHQDEHWVCAVAACDLDEALGETFGRLVGLVNTPDDIAMLAPTYETELYYRLLKGPMSPTVRQIVLRSESVRRIKAAADWLGMHNREPFSMADLAATAGMSVTSFHRHFKAVTGFSPLAFQRRLRLMDARKLLSAGGATVGSVSYDVGYRSASQFSREYKSAFGHSPVHDLNS